MRKRIKFKEAARMAASFYLLCLADQISEHCVQVAAVAVVVHVYEFKDQLLYKSIHPPHQCFVVDAAAGKGTIT